MTRQKKQIPIIFTDGDMELLAEALLEKIRSPKDTCINPSYCKDISSAACERDLCILSATVSSIFHTDPVQYLVANAIVTKAQGLDLMLLME